MKKRFSMGLRTGSSLPSSIFQQLQQRYLQKHMNTEVNYQRNIEKIEYQLTNALKRTRPLHFRKDFLFLRRRFKQQKNVDMLREVGGGGLGLGQAAIKAAQRIKFIIYQFEPLAQFELMNYFYNHYPYLMSLPMVYPHQILSPLRYTQKPFSQTPLEHFQESFPSLKVEEKEVGYICVKDDYRTTTCDLALKPKFQNSESKKTQTDSFTEKRNIVPNNINHILAFVQRKSKSESIVKKLIRQEEGAQRYSAKRFYCYEGQLKEKLHVHVNKESLRRLINHLDLHSQIFPVEQQLFYNRICRILICYYLREVARITILSSGRVRQTNKKDHLQAQRELLSFMLALDNSQ